MHVFCVRNTIMVLIHGLRCILFAFGIGMIANIKLYIRMSSSDSSTVKERKVNEDHEVQNDGDKGGFLGKVKEFIQDIGEKIEETIGFGKPTADVTGIHIPHVSLEKIELTADVLISNPNPLLIPLVDIEYLIESEERKLVSGTIPDAGTIPAHGSETVKIPVSLIYDDIKGTYKEIKPGSIIPYKVKVVLHIDIPVIGRISIPLEKTGEIPVPYKPDVDVGKIKFEQFSFEESTAILHLNLDNKNDFDLGLNGMDYELWLSNVSIASAELKESANIKKQEITTLNLPITFRPKDFGSAMWDMIRGRGTGYTIKGHIDVNTPFGHMKIPISKEGGTTRLKKEDDDDDEVLSFNHLQYFGTTLG
jgi:LEA14-like dessication related protein